jgi:hypothetical protein
MVVSLNTQLIRRAIESISNSVWDGTFEKIEDLYVVRRGTASPSNDKRGLELFCISSEPDPTAIVGLLRDRRLERVHSVILIGGHSERAGDALREMGFTQNWETLVYAKTLDGASSTARAGTNQITFPDISGDTLHVANSFCQEFKISSSSISDPSFLSRFLMVQNSYVGKIQLVLCPPYGAFCVYGAIKDSERRRGYFTVMMSAAEAWAKQRNLPQMALFSSTCANEIDLYPKLGYTKTGTYKIFESSTVAP